MWAALASAAGAIAGNYLKHKTKQQEANREYENQKEFAQNGIRWRVADAKAAGIHPIFAIGANTPTYSPQAATGTDYGLSDVGQNIGRAIEAKQTRNERLAAQRMSGLVAEAQANYYNAAAANQLAQAELAGQRSVEETLLSGSSSYVENSAILSDRATRRQSTQFPPPMPNINGNKGFDEGTPRYDFDYGLNGERVAISHSQPMHDKWEDMFLAEYWPAVLGLIADARYTLTREPIKDRDGKWYAWNGKFYAPVNIETYRYEWENAIANRFGRFGKRFPYRAGAGVNSHAGGGGV